jgi:hypothetical protein
MSTITTKDATLTFYGDWSASGPVLITQHSGPRIHVAPPRSPKSVNRIAWLAIAVTVLSTVNWTQVADTRNVSTLIRR